MGLKQLMIFGPLSRNLLYQKMGNELLIGEKVVAFINEWLDQAAREKYEVNGTNWVVDAARNIQLWAIAKHWQVGAEGNYSEMFVLRINGKKIVFKIMPAANFRASAQGGCMSMFGRK